MSEKKFVKEGIIVPLSTPFNKDESIDFPSLEKITKHIVDTGVHGIFLFGACGEFPMLDENEKRDILRTVKKVAGKKVPVLSCIGSMSTKKADDEISRYVSLGADVVVLVPQSYYSNHDINVLHRNYILPLTRELGVPFMIYDHQKPERVKLTPEIVKELSQNENFVGIKTKYVPKFIEQIRDYCPVFVGKDEAFLDSLKLGAKGGVCGSANVIPQKFVNVFNDYKAGSLNAAEQGMDEIKRALEVIYGNPIADYLKGGAQVGVKACLSVVGFCKPYCRRPFPQSSKRTIKIQNNRKLLILNNTLYFLQFIEK